MATPILPHRLCPENPQIRCALANSCPRALPGQQKPRNPPPLRISLNHPVGQTSLYTASLAALTGRALIIFRAGLALNTVGSLVKGLMPLRALVAGFLMTTNFAKPGTKNAPVLFSS